MARPEKVAQVHDVSERLSTSTAAVLTEYRGLSVGDLAELRRRLREEDAEYRIVKNTLARRAVRDAGVDLPDDLFTGPTAITFCAGDPVAAAKVLKTFSKEHPGLSLKASYVDGGLLDAEETAKLADLASREELLGQLAGMLDSLLAQPARLAKANLDKVARLLGAYQDTYDGDAAGSEGEAAGSEGDAPSAEAGEAAAEEAGAVGDAEAGAEPGSDEA